MARYKLIESSENEDQWTVYRRIWFWWYPIATRSGLNRVVELINIDRSTN
jgi:hypothetical protein